MMAVLGIHGQVGPIDINAYRTVRGFLGSVIGWIANKNGLTIQSELIHYFSVKLKVWCEQFRQRITCTSHLRVRHVLVNNSIPTEIRNVRQYSYSMNQALDRLIDNCLCRPLFCVLWIFCIISWRFFANVNFDIYFS